MCCIVLKLFYICVVIVRNRISVSQKSIAMNKFFFAKRFVTISSAEEICVGVKTLKP